MQLRVQKYNETDSFLKTLGKAYAVNLAGTAGLITALTIAAHVFMKKSESSNTDTTASESPEND